mmetsp:Transcript_21950/g.21138  ORF Transcript_21950/g.21138 Transcript_21950/m.21138 type:complete len:281 (+) Transcript_21950:3352-4194(+)
MENKVIGKLTFALQEGNETTYKLAGDTITYFDNRQTRELAGRFNHGMVSGPWYKYYDNGEKAKITNMNTGKCSILAQNGDTLAESNSFLRINIIDINFYSNGNIKNYKDQHQVRTHYENGQISRLEDLDQQVITLYSADGKYKKIVRGQEEEYWIGEEKVGSSTQFMKEGKHFGFFVMGGLLFEDEYQQNQLVSSKAFFNNGNLRRQAQYEDYAFSGKELCYYYGGKLLKEAHYEDKLPHGKTTFFAKDGQVDCVVEFERGVVKAVEVKNQLYSKLECLK